MRLILLLVVAMLAACGEPGGAPSSPEASVPVFAGEPVDCDGDGVAETDSVPFTDCDGDGIADPPVVVDPPPEATINGVAGHPVSWCWDGVCADGFLPLQGAGTLPIVVDPRSVEIPPGTRIENVRALGPHRERDSVDVGFDGLSLDPVPDGAVILEVHVRAPSGEDASYAWHVVKSESSP